MTKTEEREEQKYPTPWLFDDKGDPELLNAEQWLLQEAEIDAMATDEDEEHDDDCPPRYETLRKIVKEIRHLRKASVRPTLPDWVQAQVDMTDNLITAEARQGTGHFAALLYLAGRLSPVFQDSPGEQKQ